MNNIDMRGLDGEDFILALNSNDPDVQNKLGYIYDQLGNYVIAFDFYEKSAKQGHAKAQFNFAMLYHLGQGVEQDYEKSFYWTEKSAKQGIKEAQHTLGLMYYEGIGVKQDYEKSFYWIEKSAKQGSGGAQYSLTVYYYEGIGVKQDYKKSLAWAIVTKELSKDFYNDEVSRIIKSIGWILEAEDIMFAIEEANEIMLAINNKGILQ